MKTLTLKAPKKRRGRPLEFSGQLILLLLMIKIYYKMPYRMLEGFARFFFEMECPGEEIVDADMEWFEESLEMLKRAIPEWEV